MIPTQQMVYLGVILNSTTFRASPALKRVEKLLSIGDVFLSCVRQPCFILAIAFRSAVLDDPARARWSSPYEVSPACSTETVGSCGSVPVGQVVSTDPSGSRMVAQPRSFGARHLSGASVPSLELWSDA